MDIRTGQLSTAPPKMVERWCATAKGRRLTRSIEEDSRVLLDTFPRVADNELRIDTLLHLLNVSEKHTKVGISVSHLAAQTGLSERHVRWWLHHLAEHGFARKLPTKETDIREVIPTHWRATAALTRQIRTALEAYPRTAPVSQVNRMQINRAEFLDDIEPSRVNLSGATDYDHDVTVHQLLAEFITATTTPHLPSIRTEPRYALPAATQTRPWRIGDGDDVLIYQPDAVFTSDTPTTDQSLSIVEYERFQTKRDGWVHLEKFIAARNTTFSHVDDVTLRFVLTSKRREVGYTRLCEAFTTWLASYPDYLPLRRTSLMVSSVPRIQSVPDPLADKYWARLVLPPGGGWEMVVHTAQDSPYSLYF